MAQRVLATILKLLRAVKTFFVFHGNYLIMIGPSVNIQEKIPMGKTWEIYLNKVRYSLTVVHIKLFVPRDLIMPSTANSFIKRPRNVSSSSNSSSFNISTYVKFLKIFHKMKVLEKKSGKSR